MLGRVGDDRVLETAHGLTLRLGDVGKRLAGVERGAELRRRHAEVRGDRLCAGRTTVTAARTVAGGWSARVDDVVDVRLQVRELRRVEGLARVGDDRVLEPADGFALRLGDLRERLAALESGAELGARHAEVGADCLRAGRAAAR